MSEKLISELGEYQGFSKPRYDGFVRQSLYVAMRDGIELAVDIYRPTVNGVAEEKPLPALFRYSRYPRALELPDGGIAGPMGRLEPGSKAGKLNWSFDEVNLTSPFNEGYLMAHGYVFCQAEARGTGASFGDYVGMSQQEAEDGYDLIEWLASQTFSSGKVGMMGPSYYGSTQYLTIAQAPPSLAATFPYVNDFDDYQTWMSGSGVFRKGVFSWIFQTLSMDGAVEDGAKFDAKITPVDSDTDGTFLSAATKSRKENTSQIPLLDTWMQDPKSSAIFGKLAEALKPNSQMEFLSLVFGPTEILKDKLIDHPDLANQLAALKLPRPEKSTAGESKTNLAALLPKINAAGIPIYNMGGYRDGYTQATTLWHANLSVPKKLTLGPWGHNPNVPGDLRDIAYGRINAIERLRWFDYWLKGIENNVMEEPSINYAEVLSTTEWQWHQADTWPIPSTVKVPYYFSTQNSGSIDSVNDGSLILNRDKALNKRSVTQSFTVDYASTFGRHDRYYDTVGGGPIKHVDLLAHAQNALTYTSDPLPQDLTIAGHPVVHLEVSSTAEDGDFFVYLEQVDPDGNALYVSCGLMRASHRKLGNPPYNYLDLPWSDSSLASIEAAEPLNTLSNAKLEFSLQPIVIRITAGNRLRVVIAGCDSDGTMTFPRIPAPTQGVIVGGDTCSLIELPVKLLH